MINIYFFTIWTTLGLKASANGSRMRGVKWPFNCLLIILKKRLNNSKGGI